MKFSKKIKVIEVNDVSLTDSCEIVHLKNGEDLRYMGKFLEVDVFIHCKDTYYLFGNGITFIYKDGEK